MSKQSKRALQWAIDRAGSEKALADAIGTQSSLVRYWLGKSIKGVSPRFVLPIERATGISRHLLRPDIYPREEEAA